MSHIALQPSGWLSRYWPSAAAAISGICSCSASASTSSLVKPQNARQSSSENTALPPNQDESSVPYPVVDRLYSRPEGTALSFRRFANANYLHRCLNNASVKGSGAPVPLRQLSISEWLGRHPITEEVGQKRTCVEAVSQPDHPQ